MSELPQQLRDPGTPPFFLVGAVRSGTTLLRLLLGHHPRICRCEEFEFVASAIAGKRNWPELAVYNDGLLDRLDVRMGGITTLPQAQTFPEAAHELLLRLAQSDGTKLVGAAVHHNFDELPRLWPLSKFIYLERDPRDVARSCVEMGWAGNAWAAVRIWQAAHESWLRLKVTLPPEQRLEIKFEDLVQNTDAVLWQITAFLGLEYDRAMLEIEADTSYKRPKPGVAKSWRTESNEREIREMEARLGSDIEAAGYELSGLPKLQIGLVDEVRLGVKNRLGKMRFAQRRYGVSLWAKCVTSRRLPFKKFRRRAQLQLDEVTLRSLK